MIPESISDFIEKHTGSQINRSVPVSGGCINNAFKVETSQGNFFLKFNDAKKFPGMFESEAKGLQLLQSVNSISIPSVIVHGEAEGNSFLLLEWIESGKPERNFWKNFGNALASLHRHTSKTFGLDHDNYIGSLPQRNSEHSNWNEFFIHERIEPQLKKAIDQNKLPSTVSDKLSRLGTKINELIPKEKPALLHGDLWNGNFIAGPGGSAYLIDPAVYYGHREMDISMTKLFGGFDAQFYESYHEQFPLEKNFEERIEIHNLYPLLVHVNLFGGGYIQQVKNILSRF